MAPKRPSQPHEHASLLDRVRAALADRATREVSMFGGVSVMVDDKMLVAVRGDDALLVRVDPARSPELLQRPGAAMAVMGRGRTMGPGWMDVGPAGLATEDDLSFWLGVALEHHPQAGKRS